MSPKEYLRSLIWKALNVLLNPFEFTKSLMKGHLKRTFNLSISAL